MFSIFSDEWDKAKSFAYKKHNVKLPEEMKPAFLRIVSEYQLSAKSKECLAETVAAAHVFTIVFGLLKKYVNNEIPKDKLDLDFIIELFERGKSIKSSSTITLAESPDRTKLENSSEYKLYHSAMDIMCNSILENIAVIYEEMETASDEILRILNLR
ncbi:hypothetical protein [Sandarakinorhabdus limnophila]|uniref:hypothetical protein n=1 Tax=Sandarakinorhabdus limnophila TaxID=210512 RepID=UPI0012EC5D53|nr:hypothetical protein [Sandarakinorhabdus limnophila]